jgi:hypothetical protein
MSGIASAPHSHVYHIVMISSVCIAGLSLLTLVVFMTVAENARLKDPTVPSRVWSQLRVVFVLALVTGLLASLPFALASGRHSILSSLWYEVVYATLIALGVFAIALMVAHITTCHMESGEYEPKERRMFDYGTPYRINPSSGLPMNGALDCAGNMFGWDSHFRRHHMLDL